MLSLEKWSAPVASKTGPFSLETLIAWLEQQPADVAYPYLNRQTCALSRYFSSFGYRDVHMYCNAFAHSDASNEVPLPPYFNSIATRLPHTYGAALQRAKEFAGRS